LEKLSSSHSRCHKSHLLMPSHHHVCHLPPSLFCTDSFS
jgi:hypothetical protein